MRPPLSQPRMCDWTMSDGYALRGRVWPPGDDTRDRAIIYLHGIQSHGGWFEWSASRLAQNGTAVILPDRRGSGLNATDRGDAPSSERWLDDIDELATWAQREFGARTFDLVGVSWGGKPALAWALRRPERVERLLLIAPGLFPAVDVGVRARFQIGRSLLGGGRRMFPIPLNNPELFTDDPKGRAFIAKDPLKLTHATARFFWHSTRLDRRLLRSPAGALSAEVTLLLAGRDRIIRNAPTQEKIRRLSANRAHVITFSEGVHTLEFGTETSRFDEIIGHWGDARTVRRDNRDLQP